jgi:hypothetical protein
VANPELLDPEPVDPEPVDPVLVVPALVERELLEVVVPPPALSVLAALPQAASSKMASQAAMAKARFVMRRRIASRVPSGIPDRCRLRPVARRHNTTQ